MFKCFCHNLLQANLLLKILLKFIKILSNLKKSYEIRWNLACREDVYLFSTAKSRGGRQTGSIDIPMHRSRLGPARMLSFDGHSYIHSQRKTVVNTDNKTKKNKKTQRETEKDRKIFIENQKKKKKRHKEIERHVEKFSESLTDRERKRERE